MRKQQRRPIKRAFTGRLVGLPPDEPLAAPVPSPPAEPTTIHTGVAPADGEPPEEPPTVAPAPAKRGRKPKYANNAEKQEAYRQRKKQKEEDLERRDIVAKMLAINRRELQLPKPKSRESKAHKVLADNRNRQRKLHDELIKLPLEKLKEVFTVMKGNLDSRGRLHSERSGEKPRKYGMTEIERIIAAQGRDENGRRVVPTGCGRDADSAEEEQEREIRPAPPGLPREYILSLDEKEEIMTDLIARFYNAEMGCSINDKHYEKGQCQLCGAFIPDPSDARQHFWEGYEKGLQLYFHYEKLNDPAIREILAPGMLEEAKRQYMTCEHLQTVWSWLRFRRHNRNS